MYSVRYRVWVSRIGRKGASILPKLESLPPTTEAFRENVKRAHFQGCIWKACNMIHQSWIHLSLVGHLNDHKVLEYTFLAIFGYRAIADLTCDDIGNHFSIWSPSLLRQKRVCLENMWCIVVFNEF